MSTTTTTGLTIHDQNLEKHMGGCMTGFFNLFDRSYLLHGKQKLYPKRLPPPPSTCPSAGDSASESISTVGSPALSMELEKPELQSPVPENIPVTPKTPVESTIKSPWKFNREAPRLSLDSRAITDAKGGLRINTVSTAVDDDDIDNQRRSPSVIARLMGLEQLPNSSDETPEKKMELRRSASESRSRDYRFFDAPSFLSPVNTTLIRGVGERKSDQMSAINKAQNTIGKRNNNIKKNVNNTNQQKLMVERKSHYNTADFFPQEKHQENHQAVTIYGEIERRLRMRGIDEPLKDLETLKHILEALQLKGLLHSSTVTTATTTNTRFNNRNNHRRFSYEEESPVVITKPARSPGTNRRRNNIPSGESPRREKPARSPMRHENGSSSPVVQRKGSPLLNVETQRRTNETTTTTTSGTSSRSRVSLSLSQHSPVQSPKMTSSRRCNQTVNRSPRNRRSTVEIHQEDRIHSGPKFVEDEASTTESSFSISSQTDNERWKEDNYRDERNLLTRCDKLLYSIAEITSNNSNSSSAESQQPSPVSVLDSSFYKEDESTPSPVKKRTIDFRDQAVMDLEDELLWSPSSIIQSSKFDHEMDSSHGSEFSYVSEVIRASNYLPDETDLFMLLEKQSSLGGNRDKSKASILQRKLIFDTITEILERNRQLPSFKTVLLCNSASKKLNLEQIWSEFQKVRERSPSEDLVQVIGGMLKKDLAGNTINGWTDCPVEMSEAVLNIERLVFKDLIGETIRDLASFAGKSMGVQAPRRKLVF